MIKFNILYCIAPQYFCGFTSKKSLYSAIDFYWTLSCSSVCPCVVHCQHPYIASALRVVKLFLMSVFQHFFHHTTATPHIKHSLAMLVPHLLKITQTYSHISTIFYLPKKLFLKSWSSVSDNEKLLSYNIWKFQYLFMIRGKRVQVKTNFWNLQQFHQTCQTLVYGICRLEVWYTRSNRCSSQTPTVSHSTHRPAESESLPCSAPVEINL